ncbi:MAG: hypothetical protein R2800_00785 [Flavipsychrobacter sp.]
MFKKSKKQAEKEVSAPPRSKADSIKVVRGQRLDSIKNAQKTYFEELKEERQKKLDSTRKAQKAYNDSIQTARKYILDSTRTAQKNYFDSVKLVRQHKLDSMKAARQKVADSLRVIREYKQSKAYKDSITVARQARVDSIQAVRKAYFDSVRTVRKRIMDSTIAVRKAYIDSIKAIQKKRSDSLAVVRAYRQSKRYKDSVQIVRKLRLDSMRAVRKEYFDSLAKERKRVNDSAIAVRKAFLDSMTASRNKYLDSVKAVRKIRSDSLAKIKEERDKERKLNRKNREKNKELALELKIKKKREAWSNEKMLKKKWSLPRQVIQNTFSRYNYYFNADRKMDEAIRNMLRFRQENYDSLLALYPFDPDRDSTVLAPDMDSIIQKASLGIQIHDPRTKWGDDLYLLLGQAYYYKGDYKNAAASFQYIVSLRDKKKKKRNKSRKKSSSIVEKEDKGVVGLIKHRSVHNQAILWLARTYTESHKEGEAESVLDLIENDPNFPESLRGRMALEKAYIGLSDGDYRGATEHLRIVSNDDKLPKWIRRRASYINGQLLQEQGDYVASAESFRKTIKLHPNIDMDFYSRKNLAYSYMLSGTEQERATAMLEKVLKDGKYAKYYEQVYFVLGQLAVNNNNTEDGIDYLKKSISSPKSSAEQKGKSFALLGNVYYNSKEYENAKNSYDSAIQFATSVPDDTLMSVAVKRAGVLEELTTPLRVIRHNDSLLDLAMKTPKEQKSIVRKYIKILERRIADSIFQAENAGLNNIAKNSGNRKGNYANWYFSNPAQLQKGYNAFKQKWGNRELADDWRRLSAGGFNGQNNNEAAETEGAEGVDENGIPTEESLLAAIPKAGKEQEEKLKEVRRAYVDVANAYVQALEDYPPAIHTLDTLNIRFPDHEHKAEELYIRYIINLREGNLDKASEYSQRLIKEYSDSEWASLVQPKEKVEVIKTDVSVSNYYDETYQSLMSRDYTNVLTRARNGQKLYKDSVYSNRFRIMEAIALAGSGDYEYADSLLTDFMSAHPSSSLRSWAEAVLRYINKNKASSVGGETPAKPQPKPANIPIAQAPSNAPVAFKYNANENHYVLFTFNKMEQRAMGVKAAINDFNQFKFSSLNLNTDISMISAKQGIVNVKSFNGLSQAKIYIRMLRSTKQIFREYQNGEYDLIMISESNYKKLLVDKDIEPYLKFYQSKY